VEANTSKNHEVDIAVFARLVENEGFTSLGEQSVYQNSVALDKTTAPVSFPEKTDIKVSARSNNTVVPVNVVLTFLLVDD